VHTARDQRADTLAKHRAGISISALALLHNFSRATTMRIAKPETAKTWKLAAVHPISDAP